MNSGDKEIPILKPIPEPTLRRLPIYYQYLKKMHDDKQLKSHLLYENRQ